MLKPKTKRKPGRPMDPNALRRTGVDWYLKLPADLSEQAVAHCEELGISRIAYIRGLIERDLGSGTKSRRGVTRSSGSTATAKAAKRSARGARGQLIELDDHRPPTAAEIEDRQLWLNLVAGGDNTLMGRLVELGAGQTPWQVAVGAEDTPVSAVSGAVLGKHLTANYQNRTGDLRFTKPSGRRQGKSRGRK